MMLLFLTNKDVKVATCHCYTNPDLKEVIHLKWQLQLDGTWRNIGQCPNCGNVFVTEEIRKGNKR